MRFKTLILSLLLGSGLTGCVDLVQENPNERTTDNFWQNQEDAAAGLTAAYQGLQQNGTYGRWLSFAYDLRSDIGLSRSPWTDLSNFVKFTLTTYDFEVNREIWQHHYQALFRANQVIANVPAIEMDPALRDRYVAEARFLRALLYTNLVTLYGNVPLVTEPLEPEERPQQVTPDQVWALIEQDLADARAVLPATYGADELGRATRGAATALLGKVHMQQQEWNEAATLFEEVIGSGGYELLSDYADLFGPNSENTRESIFEVQFSDRTQLATGSRGNNIPRMIGPCGPGFCDGNPTDWYFDRFFAEPTASGDVDPRLDATIFWNRPGGMDVFGTPFAERYADRLDDKFWKKYSEYWMTEQDWDSAINFKVIRLGEVLLMYAEALNELGRTQEAYAPINRVRARVGLRPLEEVRPGLSQAEMREQIGHEIMLELGLEHSRYFYLKRHDLLDPALVAHDPEFQFFVEGKSELLPIPQSEVDLNPNVDQNPGW